MIYCNFAFSGAGTNYVSFVGAYRAFYEAGYRANAVSGTSGGAIIAAAIASDCEHPDDLERMVLDTLPSENKLIDYNWFPFYNFGIIKGDRLEKKFEEIYRDHFHDLNIACYIVTTNFSEGREEIFSHINSKAKVSEAVRASISIPFVFKKKKIGNDFYIDGGICRNFPVDIFPVSALETVGFSATPINGLERLDSPGGVLKTSSRTVSLMMSSITSESIEDVRAKIIRCKVNPNFLNLRMTREEARKLIQDSYEDTRKQMR